MIFRVIGVLFLCVVAPIFAKNYHCTMQRRDFSLDLPTGKSSFKDTEIAQGAFGLDGAKAFIHVLKNSEEEIFLLLCLAQSGCNGEPVYFCGVDRHDPFVTFEERTIPTTKHLDERLKILNCGAEYEKRRSNFFVRPFTAGTMNIGEQHEFIGLQYSSASMTEYQILCKAK